MSQYCEGYYKGISSCGVNTVMIGRIMVQSVLKLSKLIWNYQAFQTFVCSDNCIVDILYLYC